LQKERDCRCKHGEGARGSAAFDPVLHSALGRHHGGYIVTAAALTSPFASENGQKPGKRAERHAARRFLDFAHG
jgi:hypothetical protein